MATFQSTAQLRNANLPTFWQETISRTFVHCTTTLPTDFKGTVSTCNIGPISCNRVEATRHRAFRSPQDIASSQKDVVLLTLVTSGVERVVQDGREAVLHSGDFAIHDSTRPYSLFFDTSFSQIVFQIPRTLLKRQIGSFERFTAMKLSSKEQIGKLTSDFLLNIARLDDRVDPITAERLSVQTVDLIAMALGSQLESVVSASRSSHRAALLYRAKSFIEAHLHDSLSAAMVATTLGCSARYVNSLFADEGTTVGDHVLSRRLDHCRNDLAGGMTSRRVSEIAYAWGFNSAAYFCRSFKARYGMSPREYRELHAIHPVSGMIVN
jgi:AraC-like DNA-binding protein